MMQRVKAVKFRAHLNATQQAVVDTMIQRGSQNSKSTLARDRAMREGSNAVVQVTLDSVQAVAGWLEHIYQKGQWPGGLAQRSHGLVQQCV